MTGAVSYYSGVAAESAVAEMYARSGRTIAARRWRGSGGEIDIVARDGDGLIFIEVKKSRSHAAAVQRLGSRQMERIYASASEFLAGEPRGQNTEVRFDVALVDCFGCIQVLENAFAA